MTRMEAYNSAGAIAGMKNRERRRPIATGIKTRTIESQITLLYSSNYIHASYQSSGIVNLPLSLM